MSAKSKKNEINEKYLTMWREEQSLQMSCPLRINTKIKKAKAWKECQINFIVFQIEIFE